MSSFTKFDDFQLISGTKYAIGDTVSWDIGIKDSGWVLDLPKGFEFDLSVPRGFRWIISPHNRQILPASAVHDRLLLDGHDPAFASSEFRRACIARGVNVYVAWVLFLTTFVWTFRLK